jgi:hypothetical protein
VTQCLLGSMLRRMDATSDPILEKLADSGILSVNGSLSSCSGIREGRRAGGTFISCSADRGEIVSRVLPFI